MCSSDLPDAGDVASSAYIYQAALASWGGYLTWYAYNVIAETSVKVADVKNPLTDLDGDGSITPVDMVVYMHADNLASGGSVSSFGIDRKSTRLNSSHALISYAVFCLKKKTKPHPPPPG